MLKMHLLYWKRHKKRLLSIMFSLMIAMSVIVFMIYWNRSSSLAQWEGYHDVWGNFDYLVAHASEEQLQEMEESILFEKIGKMLSYGMCGVDGSSLYNAGALDEAGIDLYHYPLENGNYPSKEHEVVASRDTFLSFGVAPIVGNEVELSFYDGEQNVTITKTFVISGILAESTFPRFFPYDPTVIYPQIFFSPELEIVQELHILAYPKVTISIEEVFEFLSAYSPNAHGCSYRAMADSMIAPVASMISSEAIHANLQNAEKNFDARIVIPVCSLIIILIACICIYVSTNVSYRDRQEQFRIYRCVGMSRGQLLRILITEAIMIVASSLILGFFIGKVGYYAVIRIADEVFKIDVPLAFQVPAVVAAVTLNPHTYPFIICGVCAFWGFFIPIQKQVCRNSLISDYRGQNNLSETESRVKRNSSYVRMLNNTLIKGKMSAACIFFALIIVTSAGYFGLLYYSEKSEKDTQQLESELKQMGLYEFDYMATKDFGFSIAALSQINRQNITGITKENVDEIIQNDNVTDYAYGIEVRGTRIITEGIDEEIESCLAQVNLNGFGLEYLRDLYTKWDLSQGYNEGETLYNVPVFAITEELIGDFESYSMEGSFDYEAIRSGREIVIVLDNNEAVCPYEVGDTIRLSDVVMQSKEAQEFNFSAGNIPANSTPSFYYTAYYEDGTTEETPAYNFGQKVEFEVTVGAIVSMENSSLADFYHTPASVGDYLSFYFLTFTDALQEWGLPDENITKLGIEAKDIQDEVLENAWLQLIAESNEMNTVETASVQRELRSERINQVIFPIVLLAIICAMAIYAIHSSISLSIRTQIEKIAKMKAIGLTNHRIILFYLRTSVRYLVLAALLAWIPAYAFHQVYLRAIKENPDGVYDIIFGVTEKPWHMDFPKYDFSSQPYVLYYISVFVAIGLCMCLFTYISVRQVKKYDISVIVKREAEY